MCLYRFSQADTGRMRERPTRQQQHSPSRPCRRADGRLNRVHRAPFAVPDLGIAKSCAIIEQIDFATVQARQEVSVNFTLIQIGWAIFDSRFLESFGHPLCCVPITPD